MQPVNTSTLPVTRPETLSGNTTWKNEPRRVAPRLPAARLRSSGMLSMTPMSERIISGRKSCTKPTVMENSLYKRLCGLENRPMATSALLTMPRLPRMTIQLKERMTGLVNMGKTANAIIMPLWRECLEM